MSSHYFVKEGQEPALYISDPISFEIARPLLEWLPLVVVPAAAIEKVLSWGIKVDIVVAEDDAVEVLKHRLVAQAPLKIVSYNKSEDPFVTALYFLIQTGQKDVHVISVAPRELFVVVAPFLNTIEVVFFDGKLKWSAIPSGDFRKWYPAGTRLHIVASRPDQSVDLAGLSGGQEILTTSSEGIVVIKSADLFWVGENID